ncbi:MAG: hypothetical protein H6562_13800 [Lewinellaceae bacterium]|nr:hypothetical protein [Lewinellaceae bacterium]
MAVSIEPYDRKGRINLYDNPVETPPLEVVKKGNQAILDYFKDLKEQGIDRLYEAKLLIVGKVNPAKPPWPGS